MFKPGKYNWILIILTCQLAISCGQFKKVKPEEQKIVVDFWHAMGGPHGKLINDFAREFEKLYPEVKINAIYQGGYDQLHQKIIASITAGNVPAMAQMYESWTIRFLRRNHLEPVQNFFDLPGDGLTRSEIEDIVKVFREDNTWDGVMVTMPFNKSAYVLFVNIDLLNKVGYTSPPKTWDEMQDIAIRLSQLSQKEKIYGFATRPNIEAFTTLLFIANGSFIDEAGELTFADEVGRRSLQFLVDLVHKYKVGYIESGYLSTPFSAGKIAMFIGSTAGLPFVEKAIMTKMEPKDSAEAGGPGGKTYVLQKKFEWAVAPIPSPNGAPGRVLFQGTNIGIFARCSEAQKLMAWRFLKFMTNTQNATKWALESGYLPIRYSCLETPEMKAFLEQNPNYKVVVSQLDAGIFEPRELFWELIRSVITDQVEAALNGRRSVDEALEYAVRKCKLIIDSLK